MRKYLILFFSVLSILMPGLPAFAEKGFQIKDVVFLPREFYVGDQVELRISIETEPGTMVYLPGEYPQSSLLDIHDMSITHDSGFVELRVLFTSYAPGTRSLPPVILGDVVIDNIKIHTSSLLEGGDVKFRGIRKPLLVPGTKLLMGIFIGLLFFGPVFVLGFAGTIKKRFHLAMALRKGRKPGKKLLKAIKDLEEKKDRMSSRQFYFTLSDEYRKYLLLRTGIDFLTTTSTDFGRNLGKIIDDRSFVKAASAMTMFSDSIKFGGVTVDSRRKENDLAIVRKTIELIEKSMEEKVRRKGSR